MSIFKILPFIQSETPSNSRHTINLHTARKKKKLFQFNYNMPLSLRCTPIGYTDTAKKNMQVVH